MSPTELPTWRLPQRTSRKKAVLDPGPKPAIAYGGRRIQFFVTPMRFIVELIEAPYHRHEFAPEIFTASADEADGRS